MPAISPKRFQGVNDFHADLLSAVARCDQELKKDNHGNKNNLSRIAKAEEHKNYWHKNNLGDRITEINEGCKKAIEPLVTSEKKPQRYGKNESKEQPGKDTQETGHHMIPEQAFIKF
jgi:hypothetical protein